MLRGARVLAQASMRRYSLAVDAASYRSLLDRIARTPEGFSFYRSSFEFSPVERPTGKPLTMNLSMILNAGPESAVAGVTTGNRFPGAPVLIAREMLAGSGFRGILINNRIANVAVPGGVERARRVASAAAAAFGLDSDQVLPSSTGIIGWAIPDDRMVEEVASLPGRSCSPRELAEAIMTTDRYPKLAVREAGGATILGVAKGAGMIEPHMATMLVFLMTDARVESSVLQRVISRVAERTFNRISVDGDESTSDTVLIIANGASDVEVTEAQLEEALTGLCGDLAREIVRNGEGTAHLLEVTVSGITDEAIADRLGRAVINSPLVKTAINGNDPNLGRIIAALGSELSAMDASRRPDTERLVIEIDGTRVYSDGAFRLDAAIEDQLSRRLRELEMNPTVVGYPQEVDPVRIRLDFDRSASSAGVMLYGSDLSHQYIVENAEYRT